MTADTADAPASAGPGSIVEVAEHMLAISDGLLDDDEDACGPMTEDEAIEIVRREYVSGSCGAFAIALHDATGLPLVEINGGLHYAVRREDGLLVDFMGIQTFDDVAARYGMHEPPCRTAMREDVAADALTDDDESPPWSEVRIARWVIGHLGRW